MQFELTQYVIDKLKSLKKKDLRLFKKVEKKLEIFQKDPLYPGLRLHKLKGQMNDAWSISIEGNFRMLFRYKKLNSHKQAVFFDIGTHDEVYRDK